MKFIVKMLITIMSILSYVLALIFVFEFMWYGNIMAKILCVIIECGVTLFFIDLIELGKDIFKAFDLEKQNDKSIE